MMVMLLLVLVGYVTGECSILSVSTVSLGPSDMYDSHGCMYPRLVFSTHGWYVPELLASCLSIYKNYVFKLFQAFFLSVSFDKTVTNIHLLSITTRILLGSPHITRITTRFTTTITNHHANHHENHHNNQHSWLIDLTRITTLDSFILPSSSTLGSIHLNLYFSSTIEVSNKQNYMFNNR